MGLSILILGIILQVDDSNVFPPACAEANYTNIVDHTGIYAITTDGDQMHNTRLIGYSARNTSISNIMLQTTMPMYSNTTDKNVIRLGSASTKIVALISLMTYVAAYGMSYGPGVYCFIQFEVPIYI